MVSEGEWDELRSLGAIGDIMGSFIDIDGRPVDSPVNGHALGLGVEDLRGRRVVAVVGGNGKAKAVLGALRTGIITDLVVSETAARWIANAVGGDAVPLREVGT